MRKILKKVSASLILILMIFSVSFNLLEYGYKVYAESDTTWYPITELEGSPGLVIRKAFGGDNIIPSTFCFNVDMVNNDGTLGYIGLNVEDNYKYKYKITTESDLVTLTPYSNDNNTIQVKLKSGYKYNQGDSFNFKITELEHNFLLNAYTETGKTVTYSVALKNSISETSNIQFIDSNNNRYEPSNWKFEKNGFGLLNVYNIYGDYTVTSSNTNIVNVVRQQDNSYKLTAGSSAKDGSTCTIKVTINNSAGMEVFSKNYTVSIYEENKSNNDSNIENISWSNSDNKLETSKKNDAITLNFSVTNYQNGKEPQIQADKFKVTQSKTNINGTTKNYEYIIQLKEGQEYNKNEKINISYEDIKKDVNIEIENKKELEEVNVNITDIILKQGPKLIISAGKIVSAGEDGELPYIDWTSNEKIILQFRLKTNETLNNNSVALTGYTATLISSEDGLYKYEFEKDEIEQGTREITLSIKTNKNGSQNISEIPIKNAGEDTIIISRVHGEMKDDGRYFIYVNLDLDRDSKYDIDWCLQNIKILMDEDSEISLSNAMKVTGTQDSIAFEVLNPANEEVAGKTFEISVIAEEDNEEIDRKEATIKIDSSEFEEYSLIITDQNYISGAQSKYGSNYEYGQTTSKLSFSSGEEFWKTDFVNGKGKNNNSIFCAAKGKHMNFQSTIYKGITYYGIYNFFNASEFSDITDEQKYVLIYLNEVPATQFTEDSSTYYALQAYIWTQSNLNSGHILSDNEIQESYLPYLEKAKKAAKEAVENGGTLTLFDGRKVKIKDFSATYFEWEKTISATGVEIKYTYGSEYIQPYLTFDYELGDTPGIQLKKINEQEEPIEGVTFTILKWNSEGKLTELPDGSEFTTNEEGLTDIIPIEDGKYFISETKVPKGYKPTKQYVILNVEDGECEYEVKEAYDQALDSNGCVVVPSGPSEPDGEKASGELDWNPGEVEEDGEIELLLEVTNKIKKTDLELEILKTDSSTGEPLSGVSFSIDIPGLYSGTLTTGSDGKTEKIKIEKEKLESGTYQGTIEETVELEGYEKIDPINFTVEVKADGTISIEGTNVSTNATDELITATFAIKNTKKEEEKPPKEPDNPDEPSNPGSGVELPLLMTISGKVWLDQPQGKNSETNGEYDEGSDKLLEGITVKIYEADGKTPAKFANKSKVQSILNNQNNTKYLTSDLLQNLKSKANKIPDKNEVKTDEKGEFEFVGLDPDKKYTVKFEYNGMRYQEIRASIDVEGCGTPETVRTTTTAKAEENKGERDALTERFQNIGPYPNNYEGKLVFTQTEVENYEKKEELPDGVSESQMKQFIEDTKMHAEIKDLGGILQEAEQQLLFNNSGLDSRISSDFKFPVVKSSFVRIPMSQPDKYKEWLKKFNDGYLKGTTTVGKQVLIHEYYEYVEISVYAPHYSDNNPNNHVRIYHEKNEPAEYDGEESLIKGMSKNDPLNKPETTGHICETPSIDEYGNITYCPGSVGTFVNFGEKDLEKSYWDCTLFYVSEGYGTKVEQDKNTLTRIATFDTSDEPLYDYDKTSGKKGIMDEKWGWMNLTQIDDNNIGGDEGKEGLGKLYNMLVKKIEELEPKDQDLCLVYRPTVDLGLYNDVQKAVVTINNQTETYIYDKRASNGGIFKFGVNEYDIENGRNAKGDDEEAYAEYYDSLSNGNPDPGKNEVTEKSYDNIGMRKEDVNINLSGNGSITTNGTAIAGGYNDYDVSIEMVYRIKIYNQSAVSARVTNILDYYLDTFTFDGAFSDAECTQKISDGTQVTGGTIPAGYRATNIELSSRDLKGNASYEIFVKLHMTEPKKTLGGNVLDAGYETTNYTEINGYGTNIGVIDIDSGPGDLVPEKRFEEGPYEDDESKSPTLIFKNPENASRKMSGVVFEDVDTGKLGVQSYTGQTRNVDGTYTSGSDKPVAGAIVELVEVDESGSPVSSENEPVSIVTNKKEPGVRAQTLTKEDGTFEFNKIVASNYILRYNYGNNYETVLTKRNQVSGVNLLNEKSYNGETYENTTPIRSAGDVYWYTNTTNGRSYAMDNNDRRKIVTNNFADLTNEKAEILNSWKDKVPTGIYPKKGNYLIDELIERASMFAETEKMLLDVEYHPRYEQKIVNTDGNGAYEKTYVMDNLNFGIKERERAELQITKKVKEISILDSSGQKITGGTPAQIIAGEVKYIKMIQNNDDTGEIGFADLEIDTELLSGATLIITYEMAVTNTSETSSEQPNTIRNIQLIDYVSNNLNYDISYGNNSAQGWNPVTVQNLMNSGLLNKTSLETNDDSNRIDLLSYQTILTTTIDSLSAGETKEKELTLEKNLSAQEESDFNYSNQVEIVRSENQKGRGDYSSIYGNLDPETYTSRKGNLNWEQIDKKNKNGYPQEKTATADDITGPAIREAEKDSGNAEEVIITPPTGAKGIVLQTYHYVLALIALITTAIGITIIKKHIKIQQ